MMIQSDYKYVSATDLKSVLKDLGFYNVPTSKMEILRVGCELLNFTKSDIAYIANPTTTLADANIRLRSCRQKRTY